VSALIEEWQQETGQTFSIYGQTFDDFVKKRQNDYVVDKENEKILRVCMTLLVFSTVTVHRELVNIWFYKLCMTAGYLTTRISKFLSDKLLDQELIDLILLFILLFLFLLKSCSSKKVF